MSKIIHCCWFGGNKKTDLIKSCQKSWEKHMANYEIMEWNESNFDITQNKYVKEAYENKKWAFVSDYVRLYALYNYGGIYLDTDVELFKSLDEFNSGGFFSGFELYEGRISPITAVMGANKGNKFISRLLDDYAIRSFITSSGDFDLTTNTRVITKILIEEHGIDPLTDAYQESGNNIRIYPSSYFCNNLDSSYALHHFDGSWLPRKQKIKKKITKMKFKLFGGKN